MDRKEKLVWLLSDAFLICSNEGGILDENKVADHLIAHGVGLTKEMAAEIKRLHLQLETMTQDRNYYRAAYHHLLKERNGGAGE